MNKILSTTLPCASHWSDLGLELGLDYATDLHQIKCMQFDNQMSALREMFVQVLKKRKITWQTIVKALCSVMGRDDLADDMQEKKCLHPLKGVCYTYI